MITQARNPGRERVGCAVTYLLLLNLLFFPFLWGHSTLLTAARDAPSIYPTGAAGNSPPIAEQMLLDGVGSAAAVEPSVALERHILFDEHRLPLWNRDDAFGMPLAASMQEGTFGPFTLINILSPTPTAYAWYVILRLFVAGFFTFLFLRYFVSALAAFAGGLAFMLTGYFILFCSMPHVSIECLIPVALFCTERLVRRPTSGTAAWLAVSVGLLAIGGFPEATLLATGFATLYVALRIAVPAETGGTRRRIATGYAIGACIGLGASAVLLLPFAEFARVSFSVHPGSGPAIPVGFASVDTNPARTLGAYLVPLSLGPTWHGFLAGGHGPSLIRGYWGVAAFFFTLVAIAQVFSRRMARLPVSLVAFFSIVATFLILKRFGSPFANWIGLLPFFRQVTFIKYEEPLVAFCIAAMAAFGIDIAIGGSLRRKTWAIAAILTLAFLQASYATLGPAIGSFRTSPYFQFSFAFGITIMACVAGATLCMLHPRVATDSVLRRRIGYAIVGSIALELAGNYFVPMWFVANVQPDKSTDPYAGAPYITYLRAHLGRGERIFAERNFLYPNWQSAFDLPDIRAAEAIYDERYLPFVAAFVPPSASDGTLGFVGSQPTSPDDPAMQRLFELSGIRYVVTPRPLADKAYAEVYRADATVYRFAGDSRRARLYHDVRVADTGPAVLAALAAENTDVTGAVFLERDEAISPAAATLAATPSALDRSDAVEIVTDESQLVSLRTRSAHAGLLMLGDTDYPGWNAYVDGAWRPTERADYLFRGVALDAGAHTIDFKYQPLSYALGGAISALCLLTIAAALIIDGRFERRRASDEPLLRLLRES